MGKLSLSEWAPRAWHTLHAVTLAYPECPTPAQRRTMHQFLSSFGPVLPCAACGQHFVEAVRARVASADSPVLASRDALARWAVDVHNDVNRRTGKSELGYEVVVHSYRAAPGTPAWVVVAICVVAAALLLLAVGAAAARSQKVR